MFIHVDDVRDPDQRLQGLLCSNLGHMVLLVGPGVQLAGIVLGVLGVVLDRSRVYLTVLRPDLRVILRIFPVIIIGIT